MKISKNYLQMSIIFIIFVFILKNIFQKMDANELRRGNYILYLNELYIVTGMKEEGAVRSVRVFFSTLNGELKNAKLQSWIKPIPLTPEILEKCGFQMPQKILMLSPNDDYWFLFDDAYGFGIQVEKQGETEYICERFKIECKYLHQLQNLIYSLTNSEIKINL